MRLSLPIKNSDRNPDKLSGLDEIRRPYKFRSPRIPSWEYASGADLAPEGAAAERVDFRTGVLKSRLAAAVQRSSPRLLSVV